MRVDRRHPIILQNKVSTQNALGNRLPSYVTVRTMLAAYIPKGGTLFMGGQEVHTETDCIFNIVYPMSGVVPQNDMYILHDDVIYLVLSCLDVKGLHREMNILCKRVK